MRERNVGLLIGIIVLALAAIWVDLPTNPGLHIHLGPINFDKDIRVHQGLDLQGGLQVLLEADLAEGEAIDPGAMDAAKVIVGNRVDALGVAEPLVQSQGERRIIVELPGVKDPELAIATIRETGLLEFVDGGSTFLPPDTVVRTTVGGLESAETVPTAAPTEVVTPTVGITGTSTVGPTGEVTSTAEATVAVTPTVPVPTGQVYTTVMTGKELETANVALDQYGKPEIQFSLKSEGASTFATFTSRNVGKFLCIVLDKQVISCPRIQTAITEGQARITGEFTLEEARSLAIQLRYGALPVPLRVETTRTVGPTLGQDSVRKSTTAGAIGLSIVFLFMLVYYRFPGFLADLALAIYALLNFAIYKFGLPPLFGYVTLTLPGIAGFLLSTGMAVDANILIFERMKEELRAGRSLGAAIEAGFSRAWTSIRDSNISTIITCAILFYFGSTFGASMVKGFALTLIIGVSISMFTAVTITRTFVRLAFDAFGDTLRDKRWLLGV
ncbi:MAG: protein translocase subunit SecD [Anaerolineae bacterium]